MKIISVNIEAKKHLDKLKAFFEAEKPDVICMQELCKTDLAYFSKVTGLAYAYTPMCKNPVNGEVEGVGIYAKEMIGSAVHFIGGSKEGSLPVSSEGSYLDRYESRIFQLLVAKVNFNGATFNISNTHFPVTEGGEAEEYQREVVGGLLEAAKSYNDLLICGDFNAPRGKEIFSVITSIYKDNIPAHYTTSIDKDLHRAGDLNLMVDGMFSTPNYQVSNVELKNGVSDHLAIVAEVKKV